MSEVRFDSQVDGKEVSLKLRDENMEIERLCDTEYHVAYTQLISRGIKPKAALEKMMEEHELWTKKDEGELGELQKQLIDLELRMNDSKTLEEGMVHATAMGQLRAATLKLVEVKAAVLSNSCESLAEQIRRDAYLAYATVYADTDKPVFKSYHDFLERADEQVVLDARKAYLANTMEVFQESLDTLPEIQYTRSAEERQLMEAEKLATKKKTTRKKRTAKKATSKTTAEK